MKPTAFECPVHGAGQPPFLIPRHFHPLIPFCCHTFSYEFVTPCTCIPQTPRETSEPSISSTTRKRSVNISFTFSLIPSLPLTLLCKPKGWLYKCHSDRGEPPALPGWSTLYYLIRLRDNLFSCHFLVRILNAEAEQTRCQPLFAKGHHQLSDFYLHPMGPWSGTSDTTITEVLSCWEFSKNASPHPYGD